MQVFEETLDPSETKDFAFDWSPQLGDGETVSSQTVTMIDAAGTTNPSNSLASPVSRVWLAGGTVGLRAIFTIRAVTSGGRTLEQALAVDIVDSVLGVTAETEIDRLTREISELKAQRINVASGNAVIDVWREGRRIRKHISTIDELNSLIRVLEGELVSAQVAAGVATTSRRRAITIGYRN